MSGFKKVLIIGIGVMGGSFLKVLNQDEQVQLYVCELDNDMIKLAKQDCQFTQISLDDQVIKEIDLVIITLYPDQLINMYTKLNNRISQKCLVIDISGVKATYAAKLDKLKLNYNYLLTHPMAGRENGGYQYSDSLIFKEANFIYINDVGKISDNLLDKLLILIKEIGFNNIINLSYEEHDKAITYTSQLSHVIATSLINSSDFNENTKYVIGDSFRDLTRIANLNVEMWTQLFFNNKEELVKSIDKFSMQIDSLKLAIEENDEVALANLFNQGKTRRQMF